RHTRFSRDWSSDVCSSDLQKIGDEQALGIVINALWRIDLEQLAATENRHPVREREGFPLVMRDIDRRCADPFVNSPDLDLHGFRSEERRVGKGCRLRRSGS